MVERLKVNQLYLAPTALRLLLKSEDSYVTNYDRSTLKTLGCGKLFILENLTMHKCIQHLRSEKYYTAPLPIKNNVPMVHLLIHDFQLTHLLRIFFI